MGLDKVDKADVLVDASKLGFREAVAKRTELLSKANDFYKSIGDEDPSPDQVEYVATINKSVEELEGKIDASREYQELKNRQLAAYGDLTGGSEAGGTTGAAPYGGQPKGDEKKSLGERFAEFKGFNDWVNEKLGVDSSEKRGERYIPEGLSLGSSPGMTLEGVGRKALVTGVSPTSAGALVLPDLRSLIDLAFPRLALRDLVTNGTTQSDTIEYPRVKSYTIAAKVVAEATASDGVSGLKPESSMELVKETAIVKTIAHWIPATRRALSDAGQIRTLIDNFLLAGLDQVVEDQLLNGNGDADHLLGLTNTPDLGEQPWAGDILATTRKARTQVEEVGLAVPNGYLLNPYDWEEVELTKDGMDRYYYGGPATIAVPRLWGLPVVTAPKQPKGAGYCGDFRQMVVWDREQPNIRVSDGVRDFFLRNMVAILAELRLANGVFRPKAIVEMDLFEGKNS